MTDSNGLHLLVHANGGKYWRVDYTLHKKRKTYAIGVYPEISLAEAREIRARIKKLVSEGIDPTYQKKVDKLKAQIPSENTVEGVAREWHSVKKSEWSKKHAQVVLRRLERDIFPVIGFRPIGELTAPELLMALRQVENRGTIELAHRLKHSLNQIFKYAISTGRATRNIAHDITGTLKTRKAENRKFIKEDDLPVFFTKIEEYEGRDTTPLALKLIVLTFVRNMELRAAQWDEINFDKQLWTIPAERMKMKREHIVPLSQQSLTILNQLQDMTGHRAYLFPAFNNPRKHMAENTLMYAMYRMGYHGRATVHGFRSTASTILNENQFPQRVIEKQLAHEDRNQVRATYNHAEYLPERQAMMIWYGNRMEELGLKL